MSKGKNTFPYALRQSLQPLLADLAGKNPGCAAPEAMLPMLSFLHFNDLHELPARNLWLVADDNAALEFWRAWESLRELMGVETDIAALTSWGVIPYSFAAADREKEYHRTRAETLILSAAPCLIVASAEGITQLIAKDKNSATGRLVVASGQKILRETIVEFLSSGGYVYADPVQQPGEFCTKGGIIDIFTTEYDNPVRLDFFGDEIEGIKAFSHETQRSFKTLSEARFSTLRPNTVNLGGAIENLLKTRKIAEATELPPILTSAGVNPAGYADFYPALRECADISSLWQGEIFLCNRDKVTERLKALSAERKYFYERSSRKFCLAPDELFAPEKQIVELLGRAATPFANAENQAELQWRDSVKFGGKLGLLKERLAEDKEKFRYFFIQSEGQRERLRAAMVDSWELLFVPNFYPHGFSDGVTSVYTENDVFGRVVKKYSGDKKISRILESYTDLKEGDFIVHVNYGIGRFKTLKRMRVQNTERDFLELQFAENDKLYVPLDQLNLVHKYIGSTDNPRLDFLGKKSSWTKTRARVKRMVDSIAAELIEIYAYRMEQKGFAFGPDSAFQHDFEAAFPFTETEHQLEAIQAIKRDMESDKAMDRLVCGDVGFGKTEVAIRAAFKAAMAGKQVAILCPTTILAFQHHRSFTKRFAEYPVRIDFISRFRSAGEIVEIKQKLATGEIDIIIGTHALFSDDIKYKNLGLLIVDEEQRFGVSHKEKLRKLKHNLDCLALSATPIPRTLHMSLAGIRDLSIIETPPAERRKIETHVLADNEDVLQLAIRNELARGGQVYVLHNKVKTIEAQAARLKQINPTARIAVMHGQMPENAIEEIMVDFYQHAYDILVSTTIIESGIDIPNVNTLIVLSAHEFGLSQLYQLKGRVGRSERQAYAHFFYPAAAVLGSDAERRLAVLSEYDDLGSGFRIAMKDLEIRGAGNLLGREQSGEIMEVGFEMYSQMLQEKVEELRGQNRLQTDFNCVITLPCDWYFPESYIGETRAKMEFYKAFSAADGLSEFQNVREELIDRYGKPPEMVETMLCYEEIRHLANSLGLERVAQGETPYLIISANHRLDMKKVAELLTRDKRIRLDESDAKRINVVIPVSAPLALFRELRAILRYLSSDAA